VRTENTPQPEDDNTVLVSFLALVFVAILVALGVWLFSAKQENQRIQDCFAEHRQECVPLDTTSR
jgi:cytochrome oxidase assembly protein ShyY1